MDTIERYNNKYIPKRMKSDFIFMNTLEALRPYGPSLLAPARGWHTHAHPGALWAQKSFNPLKNIIFFGSRLSHMRFTLACMCTKKMQKS